MSAARRKIDEAKKKKYKGLDVIAARTSQTRGAGSRKMEIPNIGLGDGGATATMLVEAR